MKIAAKLFPNALKPLLSPLYRYYIRAKTWYVCGRQASIDVNPLDFHYVDPHDIRLIQGPSRGQFRQPDHISEILNGDWDKKAVPVEEYDLYLAIQSRFRNGISWEDTNFYDRVHSAIVNGENKFDCKSVEEFNKRLDNLEVLYEEMAEGKYLTQRQLATRDGLLTDQIPLAKPPEIHEVTVNVGRKGELILHEGRHRLFISQVAEVDKIPVRVKVYHKKWVGTQDERTSRLS